MESLLNLKQVTIDKLDNLFVFSFNEFKINNDSSNVWENKELNIDNHEEYQHLNSIMCKKGIELDLLKAFEYGDGTYEISVYNSIKSQLFIDENGFKGIVEFERKKRNKKDELDKIEEEKTRTDFQLAELMLENYPKTKLRANVSFYISIILALITIALAVVELYKTK